MSEYAIEIEGVSKKFYIGSAIHEEKTLKAHAQEMLRVPLRRLNAMISGKAPTHVETELWALRNIHLKIRHGEKVGIVGRNGSGKSTLLQLVASVMSPTEGSITTRGRIVAMLNIGTGFHPELTGRENVYINAAILGMSPQEVDAIYDQIVEFAEIERFMHTPLKRYSSGMRVRLAFSVAIHVKPETIILDEVLAVGDPLFREKCLRAIEERFQNITVLIVSHNIQQLKRICDRIIWMQNGEILMMGDPDEVVSAYENLVDEAAQNQPGSAASASPLLLQQAQMLHPKTGAAVSILNSNVRGMIVLRYELSAPLERLRVTCNIWHRRSKVMVISTSDSDTTPRFLQPRMPGIYNASFQLPGNLLAVGHYVADVVFDDPQSKVVLGKCQSILRFQIVDHRSKRLQWLNEPKQSILNLDIDWQYQPPQDVVESDDSQEG